MGQIEVFELLKNERKVGNDSFFSVSEVQKLMKEHGYTNGMIEGVRGDLLRLELGGNGYLEVKMSGKYYDWKRLYRVKYKYVEVKKNG